MFNLNVLKCSLILLIATKAAEGGYPCSIYLSINIEDAVSVPEGGLSHNGLVYPGHLHFEYDPQDGHQGILLQDDFTRKHRRGCVCELKPCYRKCCPENQAPSSNNTCVDSDLKLRENVYDFGGVLIAGGFDSLRAVFDVPCQNATALSTTNGSNDYVLYESGLLMIDNVLYNPSQYCIDNWIVNNTLLILHCPKEEEHVLESMQHIIHSIGMILSLPFLIITLIVYIILPDLRTLHGKSLMCYVSSLTVSYVSLTIAKLGGLQGISCVVIGYSFYYSFILSIFWLNLISYDIWWTFSDFRGYKGKKLTPEGKKFIYFCTYTFGCTTIVTTTMAILNQLSELPQHFKSNIGYRNTCWIQKSAQMTYFYGPLIVLSLINIVFFSATAFKIYANFRSTGVLRREGNTKHCPAESDRQRFWLYVKLFLIMGVTWTIEIFNYWMDTPNWYWIFVDSINALHGVLIFLIFVWKPKIRNMLKEKIKGLKDTSAATSVTSVSSNRSSCSPVSMETFKFTEVLNPDPE